MNSNKTRLLWECILLFGVLPPAIAILKIHSLMYIALWVLTFLVWNWLKKHNYNFKQDWNKQVLSKQLLKLILQRFCWFAVLLSLFTAFYIPEHLLSLPRERPIIWIMVMIFYPLLSVIPQEIIFRSFFFKRYAKLFATPEKMTLFSALAFGWVHILLLNWVAVTFSSIGGLIFANTYNKTASLAAACFEHALYGCFIFTIGLGYYFYHGQAVH